MADGLSYSLEDVDDLDICENWLNVVMLGKYVAVANIL